MKNILMCRPIHFQVRYKINPWMKLGSVDVGEAMTQWNNLVDIYKSLGINVNVIDQSNEFPDMVFAADQGIISSNKILISNFRYEERRGESLIYRDWYKKHGLEIIDLPSKVYFEGGGETVRFKNKLFVGTGFRTDSSATKYLSEVIKEDVVDLELVDDRFYHLDTCFFVMDNKFVFYYPPAFSKKSISLIKDIVDDLFEFSLQDVLGFAANSVSVDKNVLIQSSNDDFSEKVKKLGYTPIMTDVSEFIKAGGGIHCLTGLID